MKGVVAATYAIAAACLSSLAAAAASNIETAQTSRHILPAEFKPPQVFENVNLVRNINLEKSYPKETINVVIRNTGSKPETQYFIPFEASKILHVGGLEVRDKNAASKAKFDVDIVEYDAASSTQFYVVNLPKPLQPKSEQTLSITYFLISAFTPLPAAIEQNGKQYLQFSFSVYSPSSYPTSKQKTKLKLPNADIPDFTKLPATLESGITSENKEDPQVQGKELTYGPFSSVPAGALEPAKVRYEYTAPLIHMDLSERDIEVSHWGGNLATEERYWLVNKAAALKGHFSRVQWQQSAYYKPATAALKGFTVPLAVGSTGAYYVDDIGNVSTSKFTHGLGSRPTTMDIRPRYPLFGDWKYKFKIGWDQDLKDSLRISSDDKTKYILKVPFLEGPFTAEGVEYDRFVLRVILPEGAIIKSWDTDIPRTSILTTSNSLHRTFMDTIGRTVLTINTMNLNDEFRDRELTLIYEYPSWAGWRKPLTIIAGMSAVYIVVWLVSRLDVKIEAEGSAKKKA